MAITSIAASGDRATYSGMPPSTVLNESLAITSPGYDDTGSAANDVRTILITRRLRSGGNSTSLAATDVGLSMPVIAGATASGVTNNSTETSPLPVANWSCLFRNLIDGSAKTVSAIAFHLWAKHDGRPLACIIFSASDGTNTVYQTATTPSRLVNAITAQATYEYEATFTSTQMGSLIEGAIRYDFRAIPWAGDNTAGTDIGRSIANTADFSTRGLNENWDAGPRYDLKDLTRFANPPRAYIDSTSGNNTTGRWSATDATARLLPFLTAAGAVNRSNTDIVAGSSAYAVAGDMSGCEIRFKAGTHTAGAGTVNRTCKGAAALVLRNDPNDAPSSITVDIAAMNMRCASASGVPGSAQTLRNIGITRSSTSSIITSSTITIVAFDGVLFNNNSINANVTNSPGTASFVVYNNCTFSNMAGGSTTMGSCYYMKGCTGLGVAGLVMSPKVLLATRISNVQTINVPDYSIRMGNFVSVRTAPGGSVFKESGTGRDILDACNINEMVQVTTGAPFYGYSLDAATTSTDNILHVHNTTSGYSANGRYNWRYVDNNSPTGSRDRTHKRGLFKNNIGASYNSKHDLFSAGGAGTLRTGGWSVAFGVGHDGNLFMYTDANGGGGPTVGGFGPDYEGPRSVVGTSLTVAVDPLFTLNGATVDGVTAGVGDGDYSLGATSPARNITEGPLFPGLSTTAGAIHTDVSPNVTAALTMPAITAAGTINVAAASFNVSGVATMAPLTAAGAINVAATVFNLDATALLPALTSLGTITVTINADGDVLLPSLTAAGLFGTDNPVVVGTDAWTLQPRRISAFVEV